MAPPKLRSLVPIAHVADVARSIAFYEKLGFHVGNTFQPDGSPAIAWVWLASDGADIMLTQAGEPVDPKQQAVFFYVYCDDVQAMHAHVEAVGIAAGPIKTPFYAPRGEFAITDPDGYAIMITHT